MKSIVKSIQLAAEIFTVPILVSSVIIAHMIGPAALSHRDTSLRAKYFTTHGKQQITSPARWEC